MFFILTYLFWKSVESFKSCDGFFKDLQNRRSLFVFNNKEFEIPPRKQVIFDLFLFINFFGDHLSEKRMDGRFIFSKPQVIWFIQWGALVPACLVTHSQPFPEPYPRYCLYHKLIESDVARRLIRVAVTVTRGWNSDYPTWAHQSWRFIGYWVLQTNFAKHTFSFRHSIPLTYKLATACGSLQDKMTSRCIKRVNS